MKKILLSALVALMVLIVGAGCSSSTNKPEDSNGKSGGKTKVIVWGLDPMAVGSGNKEMIEEFNKTHAGIEIVPQSMPGSGGYDTQDLSKLTAAIASGSPPDVVNLNAPFIMEVASRGILMPLDEYIEKSNFDLSRFYPYTVKEMTFQGKIWGLPVGIDDRILYYNKDMMANAGLDPESPPVTWDELLEYGQKMTIKDDKGGFKQIGFIPNFGNSWLYLYSIQNNGKYLDDEGKKVLLNSPENVEALEFMVKGYDMLGGAKKINAYSSTFQGGANDPFLTGKVAMVTNGNWAIADIARFAPNLNFGVAMPPTPTGADFKTWSGGWSWGIPKGAKNPEAAFEVVSWLTTEGPKFSAEGAAKYNAEQKRITIPSWTANIDTNQFLMEKYVDQLDNQRIKDAVKFSMDALEHSISLPVSPVGQLLWSEHARAIDEAIYHKGEPQEILDAAAKKVQEELDKFWKNNKSIE
ncbi:ABC transporter substrate-binding protein [Paenibacillus spongiae]|uniref:ABC transporter substrate-binding protein n=1 Tax=Paenibacillus spongiae TaxID=2909671 RepID=A0ABY5SC56_9BACL|nr:ABC transporter substrate-binding protein [Paenibacillus spongiae]UVI31244.1 ABC transporter substrate-binding protein [Paenibacillus spongiae]